MHVEYRASIVPLNLEKSSQTIPTILNCHSPAIVNKYILLLLPIVEFHRPPSADLFFLMVNAILPSALIPTLSRARTNDASLEKLIQGMQHGCE